MRTRLFSLASKFLLGPLAAAAFLLSTVSPLAAQEWAKAKLDKSPRHREWVQIHYGGRTVQAYVVYPEVKEKAPVVLMIHEIFGLSDWMREMADEVAAAGSIAVAPDLLSGFGPKGGGSSDFADQDATVKAVFKLDPSGVTADLDAVADYARKIPSSNGKLAVAGFCWGGSNSFAFATHRKDLSAAFVFYGNAPDAKAIAGITAPIYGFYAEKDARVSATIPATTEAMRAAGKQYEPVTYPGAGHGFMRAGEAPDASPDNKEARDAGLARLTLLLKAM